MITRAPHGPPERRADRLPDVREAGLPPVEAVEALPPETLPAFVAQLAALAYAAAARMVRVDRPEALVPMHADRLVTLPEAAEMTALTEDYIRRNRSRLGFVVAVGPGTVRCSMRQIERFIAARTIR